MAAKQARALVERLFDDYGVRLVAFDIVFAEPDESSGLKVLETLSGGELANNAEFHTSLARVRDSLDYDAIFAATIARYPVVLGYYFNIDHSSGDSPRVGTLPEPVLTRTSFQGKNIQFLTASGYGGNLDVLVESATGAGHFTQQPDPDGVVRRVPMLVKFEDAYYPSLSLEVVRQVLGASDVVPRFEQPLFDTRGYPGLEWLTVDRAVIPVDRQVKTLVPFRDHRAASNTSRHQVLHGTADRGCWRGASCWSGPARRACSICVRRRSVRPIPVSRCTPT